MDSGHCYCGQLDPAQPAGSFQCSVCKKRFHHDCLDNPIMTSLHGDSFFIFKCRNCGQDNREEHEHAKMSWVDTISLTLYNLQLGGGGKCGYYRWKEHICSFIDKNWTTFFGHVRKKTNTWLGTVAGTLSGHCPLIFLSGLAELGESGWWRLTEMKPPTYNVEPPAKVIRKKKTHGQAEMIHENYIMNNIIDRPRRPRSQPFSLTAAIELKARRIPDCNPTIKRRRSSLASKMDIDGSCSEHGSTATSSSTVEACVSEQDSGEWQTDLTKAPPAAQAPESGDAAPTEPYVTVMVKIEQPDDNVADCLYQTGVEEEADVVAASPSTGVTKIKEEVTDTEEAENDTVAHLLGVDLDSDESDMEIDPGSFSPLANVGLSNELNQSTVIDDMMLYLNDRPEMVQSTSAQCRGTGSLSQQSSRSQMSMTSDSKAVTDPDSDLDCPSEGAEDGETSEGEEEEEEEEEDCFEEETGDEETQIVEESQIRGEPLKRHQKRRKEEEQLQKENLACNLRLMTPYDEKLILKQLNKIMHLDPISTGDKPLQPWEADRLKHKRNVLRRKLIVRRLKREKGLPIFDLDATLAAMSQLTDQPESLGLGMPMNKRPQGWERTLDRFLLGLKRGGHESRHKEFRTRLVGFEDDQLQPITSPYTMRVLKPFIWRNQETMPMKVKLLQEIIAYPHRNDSTWQQPLPATLDYCYVRPQHIPAVNALCRSFFWPGIDLAECLQYPDFSCVVMYKKLVVAFAFLVPDVKHNEAYISFIFTHPEWRGAGIATFMLYHLIQTCMGKDVTLHVSATNPAMLLYSKFGFKAEELCLDFYDKYLPVESKECRHAFFMRLRR